MKVTNLERKTDELTLPIKLLLQALIDSHLVIEKYTQPSVLKIISDGINPVTIQPKEVERIVVFGDILSYSSMAEQLGVEDIFLLINTYFEICTRIITKKGGEVNKFIGDGFMAYFNGDNADLALEACIEILKELKQLRITVPANSPLSLLYSGYGIDKGMVVEGNMGSGIKMDYTIIGDAVNTAARLEDHTRVVEKSIVLSELVKTSCTKKWDFIRLGQFYLKGQREHTAVYSINHKLVDNFKDKENLSDRIEAFAIKFKKE
jgi:class 3 adenylate cyclase